MNQVLIIGFVWPEPRSSAAGSRMLQLIDVLLANNYKITFASPCAKSENAFNLETHFLTFAGDAETRRRGDAERG